MSEPVATGHCGCGVVTWTLHAPPLYTQACHCTDCQRSTGSAFVVNVIVAEQDFAIRGPTASGIGPTGSGAGCELHWCTECGTYLWSRYLYHPVAVIAIRGGTCAEPARFPPQAHIFTRSKLSWVRLPEGVPTFEAAIDRDAAWPGASVEKYEAQPPPPAR